MLDRLIVRFKNLDVSKSLMSHRPQFEVSKLYGLNLENTSKLFNKISEAEQNLHKTFIIVSTTGDRESLNKLYEELKHNNRVDYVQYDQRYELYKETSLQSLDHWWFPAINYDNETMAYTPSRTIKIAVVDTGIDHNHPDLDHNSFKDEYNRRDFTKLTWWGGKLQQPNGHEILSTDRGYNDIHGTHVVGIIAALRNKEDPTGIAYWSEIMNIRAFPDANESTLSAAIRYAVDNGVQIINASWGCKINSKNPGATIKGAIDYACSKGVIVVCAAGNNNDDVKNYIPAGFSNVITVGSVNKTGQPDIFIKSTDSNYGQNVISAPGVGILSLNSEDDTQLLNYSGTSMSTAFVTGLVARMLDKRPKLITKNSDQVDYNPATEILKHIQVKPIDQNDGSISRGMIDIGRTLENL